MSAKQIKHRLIPSSCVREDTIEAFLGQTGPCSLYPCIQIPVFLPLDSPNAKRQALKDKGLSCLFSVHTKPAEFSAKQRLDPGCQMQNRTASTLSILLLSPEHLREAAVEEQLLTKV